jgi:hypothetical protein
MHIRTLSQPDYHAWVRNLAAWDPNPLYLTAEDLKDSPGRNALSSSPHAGFLEAPSKISSHTRSSSLSDASAGKDLKESTPIKDNGTKDNGKQNSGINNGSKLDGQALFFGSGQLSNTVKVVSADFENVKNQSIALGRALEGHSAKLLHEKTYQSILKLQLSLTETLSLMQDVALALDWTVRDDNRNRSLLGMPLLAQPGDDISKLASILARRPSIFAPSSIGEDEFHDAIEYHGTPPVSDDEQDSDAESLLEVGNSEWKRTRERSSSNIALLQESTLLPMAPILRRKALPTTGSPESPVSIVGILRKNMGKDLSTIAMPVSLNEPLSALQRYALFPRGSV